MATTFDAIGMMLGLEESEDAISGELAPTTPSGTVSTNSGGLTSDSPASIGVDIGTGGSAIAQFPWESG
ncbi:MAG: hypothetical protein Phyf2KO_22260 [Phycisphaerales bacterium]